MGTQDGLPIGHIKDTRVAAQAGDGVTIHARLSWLARHAASFEIQGPRVPLQLSGVLDRLEIILQDDVLYSGRGVVTHLINSGANQACEVSLSKDGWTDGALERGGLDLDSLPGQFEGFLAEWQKLYRVRDEFKVVISDIETLLSGLRVWLNQVELGIAAESDEERARIELAMAQRLRPGVTSTLTSLFERFEVICEGLDPELVPAHRAFARRRLHPHLLCSPFIHRTFAKPLGYAGDYEMMNMINRDPLEGDSIFAMLMNAYLLDQVGPQAVRNRVGFLHDRIAEETARVVRQNRDARIYVIACGPAREVQQFIAGSALSDHASFSFLDFNEETLEHARERITAVRQANGRKTSLEFVRTSVQALLRAGTRSSGSAEEYDLIYCSGLYDYLSDEVCRALNTYLHDRLAPGGLLVVGNFAPNTPVRYFIEHVLEWFLIYRSPAELARLAPAQAAAEDCVVRAEPTTTNIFMEVRKPA